MWVYSWPVHKNIRTEGDKEDLCMIFYEIVGVFAPLTPAFKPSGL